MLRVHICLLLAAIGTASATGLNAEEAINVPTFVPARALGEFKAAAKQGALSDATRRLADEIVEKFAEEPPPAQPDELTPSYTVAGPPRRASIQKPGNPVIASLDPGPEAVSRALAQKPHSAEAMPRASRHPRSGAILNLPKPRPQKNLEGGNLQKQSQRTRPSVASDMVHTTPSTLED